MKLLLIRPFFSVERFYFPRFISESLGIESLTSFLSLSHSVKMIDAIAVAWNNYWEENDYPNIIFQGLKPKKLLKQIKKYNPEVIGLNWLFSTQNSSIDLTIKIIKKVNPKIPIVVGGPHPSSCPKQTLEENKGIDIVVFGEGELTMKELLDNKLQNLEKITGIAYRKDNQIIKNPARKLIENLDSLPIPKRLKSQKNYSKQNIYEAIYLRLKKLNLKDAKQMWLASRLSNLPFISKFYYYLHNRRHNKNLPRADIITSRGCPNHCTFCAIHNIWGHSWRMRSAESVLAEIDYLVKKLKVKHISIQDDNFNVSKERIIKICQGIVANKYKITLSPDSGAYISSLDEEMLTWLKRAGFNQLRLSIESGNEHILHNVIKKNIDLSKVKGIVAICKKLDIETEGAFIFGIPGETIETMKESLEFAKNVGFDRVVKFIFQPFPNTELYKLCLKSNYLTEDYDPKRLYVTGNKCFVKTDKFSPEDVLRIVNRQND